MARDRLGFTSPFLTVTQKAALRKLEEGLEEDDDNKIQQATRAFLHSSFELTQEAVLEFWPRLDLSTFEEIRDVDEDSDVTDQLRQLLWNGDNLSPFASRLLSWSQGDLGEDDLLMTVPELNSYLAASVDFYEGLRPVCASGEFDVPVLNLLEPPSPPSLELPEPDELTPGFVEPPPPEPLTMIELVWEPRPDKASPAVEERPAPLKLLWESAETALPELVSLEKPEPIEAEALEGESAEELRVLILGGPPEPEKSPSPKPEPEAEVAEGPAVEVAEGPEVEEAEELDVEVTEEPEVEDAREPEVEVTDEVDEPPRPGKLLPQAELDPEEVPSRTKGKPAAKEDDGMELIAMSAAPLSPTEAKTQLIVKKKYLGYGKNSDGVMGYCGQLTLSRFDDEAVSARLECSNPLLFLSPTTPSGKSPVVTYWMPPAAFPQPGGHLTINTSEQNKVMPVGSLFPKSRTDFLNKGQVILLLLAPSILGLLYFSFVYLLSASGIVEQVKRSFPEVYQAALNGSIAVDFRSQGVGLYQLEIVPASESLQLIWVALIWLCPLLASKFFRHLSRSRQRDFGAALAGALVLPSLGLFLIWNAEKSVYPIFDHPDFAPLDLRNFLPWSVPLNLAVAAYLFLSVHGVWDRRLASGARFLLPVFLSAAYMVLAFLLIFGRSWAS